MKREIRAPGTDFQEKGILGGDNSTKPNDHPSVSHSMEVLLPFLLFSLGINFLMFLIAYALQTDKLTDISYSLTFMLIAGYSYWQSEQSMVDFALLFLVLIWGFRLGGYLLYRIQRIGRDKRFDDIRISFKSFFLFWLMQGLTCFIVMIPILMAHRADGKVGHWAFWVLGALALVGWAMEAIADAQKFNFKLREPNAFMDKGLYAYLQHPNYAGELLFWWSVSGACLLYAPWYVLVGPLWISFIILRFSGISLLQQKWEEKYGENPAFQAYRERTWKLLPGIY
jgi:steroid 5-alpha reductase family enzyme